jgi:hypothetical protein
MIQETIKLTLDTGTTTNLQKKQLISGQFIQVQGYTNNTDETVMLDVTINDASGTPIIRKQPLANLRSRDGQYLSNMPLSGISGNDIEVVIEASKPVATNTIVSVVFDINPKC